MFTHDPLPSWNEGRAKDSILAFVQAVSDPASASYVRPEERIATFDNDGTLWCEGPLPVQVGFVLGHLKQQVAEHPELQTRQPYQELLHPDPSALQRLAEAYSRGQVEVVVQFLESVMTTFEGMSVSQFEAEAQAFFDAARHPRFQVPYRQCIYQPMVELLQLLQAQAFTVYINSAGGRDFMRVVSEDLYGIARQHVIGGSVELTYQPDDKGGRLLRQSKLTYPFADGVGKPITIQMRIGRQPILVGGNSSGDLPMLLYAQEQHQTFLGLLLQHDDAEREYAYDAGAQVSQLAEAHQWTIISMKKDFTTVFPVALG